MTFMILVTQFRVVMATNYRALTRFMNVNYVVGHKQARSVSLQCIMYILLVITIFSYGYFKYSVLDDGGCFGLTVWRIMRGRWR
jgi:hypothetical protein